jgi:hypothetical protein
VGRNDTPTGLTPKAAPSLKLPKEGKKVPKKKERKESKRSATTTETETAKPVTRRPRSVNAALRKPSSPSSSIELFGSLTDLEASVTGKVTLVPGLRVARHGSVPYYQIIRSPTSLPGLPMPSLSSSSPSTPSPSTTTTVTVVPPVIDGEKSAMHLDALTAITELDRIFDILVTKLLDTKKSNKDVGSELARVLHLLATIKEPKDIGNALRDNQSLFIYMTILTNPKYNSILISRLDNIAKEEALLNDVE